jgi:hypothetical protein
MKKIIILLASLFMIGCVSVGDIKKESPVMNKVVTGNYADISRCVVSGMESDSRWTVSSLNYDIRVYSDNKTSEVIASASSGFTGKMTAFRLSTKQINQKSAHVDLRGLRYDTENALEYLKSCVK